MLSIIQPKVRDSSSPRRSDHSVPLLEERRKDVWSRGLVTTSYGFSVPIDRRTCGCAVVIAVISFAREFQRSSAMIREKSREILGVLRPQLGKALIVLHSHTKSSFDFKRVHTDLLTHRFCTTVIIRLSRPRHPEPQPKWERNDVEGPMRMLPLASIDSSSGTDKPGCWKPLRKNCPRAERRYSGNQLRISHDK